MRPTVPWSREKGRVRGRDQFGVRRAYPGAFDLRLVPEPGPVRYAFVRCGCRTPSSMDVHGRASVGHLTCGSSVIQLRGCLRPC